MHHCTTTGTTTTNTNGYFIWNLECVTVTRRGSSQIAKIPFASHVRKRGSPSKPNPDPQALLFQCLILLRKSCNTEVHQALGVRFCWSELLIAHARCAMPGTDLVGVACAARRPWRRHPPCRIRLRMSTGRKFRCVQCLCGRVRRL